MRRPDLHRRTFLKLGTAALPLFSRQGRYTAQASDQPGKKSPTVFQLACMTLPYSEFPLQRALTGIQSAGFKYVAWGTAHKESDGKSVPVISSDAPPEKAKELG